MSLRTAAQSPALLEWIALSPLRAAGRKYVLFVLLLLAVIGWGVYAYWVQLRDGLAVTGLNDGVLWGVYIINFVFFLGIAMAGTVISAVLRLTHAGWRTPITRMAEVVTVSVLSVGALMPVIDLGRPDRVWHVLVYGRFQSAIMWDIIVISTYLAGSLIYLYLPLIPDFAHIRDSMAHGASSWKKALFNILAVGWHNGVEQRRRLERGIGIMAVAIIPMAALTHTVASFIFAWMLRPGWNSTVYGIYFVIGAIFSGIATILIVMAIVRRIYHLEALITEKHFKYLSYLLLTAMFLYLYLVLTEFLTLGYKLEAGEKELLTVLFTGSQSPWFWLFIIGAFLIPAWLIAFRRGSPVRRIVTAAILVNISMWLGRWLIVVPVLQVPQMPGQLAMYSPTWVEWSITLAAFAGFMLIFALLVKLLPVVSVWEVREESQGAPPVGEDSHE